MLENVKKIWKKSLSKSEMIEFILSLPEHQWMRENQYIVLNITEFLERLPLRVLSKVFYEESTILVQSNGKFACSVTNAHQNAILIFPELYNYLTKINDGWAKAVLAHEVAHIYFDHKNNNDIMETQVEADEFACEMGYLDQIEDFLLDQPESIEKRVRLSFVTTYYFAKVNPDAIDSL